MANNQDLYKQAIAEAKSIRETAVANAKQALEETLTPHIKSLLAAKLQEMEEEEMEEVVTEEEEVEEMHGDKGNFEEVDEAKDEEAKDEEAEDDSEESEDEAEESEEEEIEVKDMEVEDLKNLIRDVIAQEMGNMNGEEEMDMDMDGDGGMEGEDQPVDMVGAEDEEINLEELLAELEGLTLEEDSLEEAKSKIDKDKESKKMKKDLDEALQTISTLRTDLSEVNLLNAKLLYLNKIFRATNLTEAQKASAISAFDRAASTKEVKLVYETLKEGFTNTRKDTIKEHKGFASKATGVAPKKEIISEVSEQVRRMQKLAGII
jgi:hypothetical protein